MGTKSTTAVLLLLLLMLLLLPLLPLLLPLQQLLLLPLLQVYTMKASVQHTRDKREGNHYVGSIGGMLSYGPHIPVLSFQTIENTKMRNHNMNRPGWDWD